MTASSKALARNHPNKGASFTRFLKCLRRHWILYAILLVPIAYIIIFKYVPMLGIQLAFKDYRANMGIWGSPWAGLKYFNMFFKSPMFTVILKNTLILSLYSLIATFPMAILLAIMVNEVRNQKFRKTVQMVTYAPYFISTVVLVSILIQLTYIRGGLFNQFIGLFGGDPVNFFGESKYFSSLYVWSGVWQSTGYSSIIYIAALSGVDPSLYEAATIDGATRFQKIRHIDFPSILPTAIILLIVNVGQIMSIGFEKVYLMQTPLNLDASQIIATYAYKIGLVGGQFSFSTAIDLFNSAINMILLVTVNSISRKVSDSSLW